MQPSDQPRRSAAENANVPPKDAQPTWPVLDPVGGASRHDSQFGQQPAASSRHPDASSSRPTPQSSGSRPPPFLSIGPRPTSSFGAWGRRVPSIGRSASSTSSPRGGPRQAVRLRQPRRQQRTMGSLIPCTERFYPSIHALLRVKLKIQDSIRATPRRVWRARPHAWGQKGPNGKAIERLSPTSSLRFHPFIR